MSSGWEGEAASTEMETAFKTVRVITGAESAPGRA